MWFIGQGLSKGVLAHPPHTASYAIPVRQLQRLQSGFLQTLAYPRRPCRLLIGFTNLPIRDLHPLDNNRTFLSKCTLPYRAHTLTIAFSGPPHRNAKP